MAGQPKQKRPRDATSSSQPPAKKAKPSSSEAQLAPTLLDHKTSSAPSLPSPADPTSTTAPADPVDLSAHDVTRISILSSSAIQQRTTRILGLLRGASAAGEDGAADGKRKACLVRLHAAAKAGAKLISVVEIVKRELKAEGVLCFQYTAVEGVMKEQHAPAGEGQKKKENGKEKGGADGDVEEEDEEEEGFEVMKTPFERSIEGQKKVRAVPMLTIWLAREKIEALGRRFGEQNNGVGTAA